MFDKEKASQIISDIVGADGFKDLSVQPSGKVVFNLLFAGSNRQDLVKQIEAKLKAAGFTELDIYSTQQEGHRPIPGTANRGSLAPKSPVPGVKHIIAINSGKGGVGKTTCSVNFALALAHLGYKVGLLDADITGPNVHLMMGISEKPYITEDRKVKSLEAFGVRVISMGTLVDEDKPTIWRGPMLDGVIKQFLREVEWGELDYLVVDLPPGTSDAQLTLCQNVPLAGAIIITTPQDVALLDARKGLMMFQKMGVKIFGLIENMSFFECPHCHERSEIFSHGGGRSASANLGLNFLGAIPIDIEVRSGGDQGKPITAINPGHSISQSFIAIAKQVVAQVSETALV